MDRATRGKGWPSGATLTWHVGRYQVLPRHRVDAERRRMCDRSPRPPFPSSVTLFVPLLLRFSFFFYHALSLSFFLPFSHSSLPSCARAAHTTLVSPRFLHEGRYTPAVVSRLDVCATLAPSPLPSQSATTSRRRISHRHYAANLP